MNITKTKIKILTALDKHPLKERILILNDLKKLYKTEDYFGLSKHDLLIIKK